MKMGFLALGHKFFLALVPEHNIFFSPRAFGPRAEKNVCVQALGPKKIYALVLKNPFSHPHPMLKNPIPKRLIKILGILQIICGILVIVLQVGVTKMFPKNLIKFVTLHYDISDRFCHIL